MTPNERIARLLVKLDHIEPAIWRRVEVPITSSLKGRHDVIQAVMLFQDYHLFEFNAGGKRYAVPSRPSRTPIRQSNIRDSSTATGARRRKTSAACPDLRISSTPWQSLDMRNTAKSWRPLAR
jgi:hypothetical protein